MTIPTGDNLSDNQSVSPYGLRLYTERFLIRPTAEQYMGLQTKIALYLMYLMMHFMMFLFKHYPRVCVRSDLANLMSDTGLAANL